MFDCSDTLIYDPEVGWWLKMTIELRVLIHWLGPGRRCEAISSLATRPPLCHGYFSLVYKLKFLFLFNFRPNFDLFLLQKGESTCRISTVSTFSNRKSWERPSIMKFSSDTWTTSNVSGWWHLFKSFLFRSVSPILRSPIPPHLFFLSAIQCNAICRFFDGQDIAEVMSIIESGSSLLRMSDETTDGVDPNCFTVAWYVFSDSSTCSIHFCISMNPL